MPATKFRVRLFDFRATNLSKENGGNVDPYLKGNFLFETPSLTNSINPVWDKFEVAFNYETQYSNKLHKKTLVIDLFDKEFLKDDVVGSTTIDLNSIATGCEAFDLPLFQKNRSAGRVQFRCSMEEVDNISIWFRQIGCDSLSSGVSPYLEYFFDADGTGDSKDIVVSPPRNGSDPEWIDCLEMLTLSQVSLKSMFKNPVVIRVLDKNRGSLLGLVRLDLSTRYSFSQESISFEEALLNSYGSPCGGFIKGTMYFKQLLTFAQMQGVNAIHNENGILNARIFAPGVQTPQKPYMKVGYVYNAPRVAEPRVAEPVRAFVPEPPKAPVPQSAAVISVIAPVIDASLPAGWEKCVDPSSGKIFYKDHFNKTTSWTVPTSPAVYSTESAASSVLNPQYLEPVASAAVISAASTVNNPQYAAPNQAAPVSPQILVTAPVAAVSSINNPVYGDSNYLNANLKAHSRSASSPSVPVSAASLNIPVYGDTFVVSPEERNRSYSSAAPVYVDAGLNSQDRSRSLSSAMASSVQSNTGIEACVDPKSGRIFYRDHINKTTSWNPPARPAPVAAPSILQPNFFQNPVVPVPLSVNSLPNGWEKCVDQSGRVFYKDHINHTTSWNPPVVESFVASAPVIQPQVIQPQIAQSLPDGWEKCTDPNSGKVYYKNHINHTTSWTAPVAAASSVIIPAPQPPLPPGWEQCLDPNTNRIYYKNHQTQSTSWERPAMQSKFVSQPVQVQYIAPTRPVASSFANPTYASY